ncbi:MAG: hypothetical protein ACLQU4_00950 [Limisphaerales bacterium]
MGRGDGEDGVVVVGFKAHLQQQAKFIKNSCRSYDEGDVEEAVRIAVALRVCLYDTQRCVSLLTHLRSNSIPLLSTAAPFVEDPILSNLYLVQPTTNINLADESSRGSMRCICRPLLDLSPRNDSIAFNEWWEEVVIEHKQPQTAMTRKELVLAAADKDGGAHVDKELNPIYDFVRCGSGLGIEIHFQPKWGRTPRTLYYELIHFASLRQIGYEVLHSPSFLAISQ